MVLKTSIPCPFVDPCKSSVSSFQIELSGWSAEINDNKNILGPLRTTAPCVGKVWPLTSIPGLIVYSPQK